MSAFADCAPTTTRRRWHRLRDARRLAGRPSPQRSRSTPRAKIRGRNHGTKVAVATTGGTRIDPEAVRATAGPDSLTIEAGKPVAVLAAASADSDLLIVGSCGLHGLRALGSVSERIAQAVPFTTLNQACNGERALITLSAHARR